MKIKKFVFILLACYLGVFLRLIINNNFIISILGSFFVGFFIRKRLSYSNEKILFSGFFSCFTSFSGFIYFLHNTFHKEDWIQFMILLNLMVIMNLFMMCLGFWISRKITYISYNDVVK